MSRSGSRRVKDRSHQTVVGGIGAGSTVRLRRLIAGQLIEPAVGERDGRRLFALVCRARRAVCVAGGHLLVEGAGHA